MIVNMADFFVKTTENSLVSFRTSLKLGAKPNKKRFNPNGSIPLPCGKDRKLLQWSFSLILLCIPVLERCNSTTKPILDSQELQWFTSPFTAFAGIDVLKITSDDSSYSSFEQYPNFYHRLCGFNIMKIAVIISYFAHSRSVRYGRLVVFCFSPPSHVTLALSL